MKLIFQNDKAREIYHAMAEGMLEVAEDNNVMGDYPEEGARGKRLEEIMHFTREEQVYPLSVEFPERLQSDALAVRENCLDRRLPEDPAPHEDDDVLQPEDIIVEGEPE